MRPQSHISNNLGYYTRYQRDQNNMLIFVGSAQFNRRRSDLRLGEGSGALAVRWFFINFVG